MFKNMFKTSIAIISILILISTIYSATIITLDYFDGNNTKPVEPRGDLGMRGFHEPSPEPNTCKPPNVANVIPEPLLLSPPLKIVL